MVFVYLKTPEFTAGQEFPETTVSMTYAPAATAHAPYTNIGTTTVIDNFSFTI